MARQLVRPQVDFAAVGEAGMVRNYEGEALAAIGTIIGEAISNVKPKADKIKEQEQEIENIDVPVLEDTTEVEQDLQDIQDKEDEALLDEILNQTKKVDESLEKPLESGGKLDKYRSVYEKFTDKQKNAWTKRGTGSKRSGVDDYIYYMENELPEENIKARESVRSFAASKPKGFVYDPLNPTHVNEFKESKYFDQKLPYNFLTSPTKRLKDDSPFERQRQVSAKPRGRGLAGMSNEQQFNMQAMQGAAMSQLPSEASGRSFVEKQRYLRTPSWASGTSVAAAIEGWNIGVEASNYRAQVAADLKDYQTREFESMQEQAKEDSLIPRSFLASTKSLQTAYVAAQKLPAEERELVLSQINMQLTDLERSKTVVMDGQKFVKDNMNNIAWDLTPAGTKDKVMTFLEGGGVNGFIPNKNGVMSFTGTTRNDIPFSLTLDEIAGPKGLLASLPVKVDIYGTMSTIADDVEKSDYTRKTVDADGIIREQPVPLDDLKNTIDYELNEAIASKGLKGLASALPIYQGPKGLDAFNLGLKLPQNHPDHPVNVVKDNMSRGILHKLTAYMGQVTEEEGKGALEDQKQRNRMEKAAYDAEQRRRLEQLKGEIKSEQTKSTSGRNKAKQTVADYSDISLSYAENIVNKNDPMDLVDRLKATEKYKDVAWESQSRQLMLVPKQTTKREKVVDEEGDTREKEVITGGSNIVLDFNRSVADLVPVISDIMYNNDIPVRADKQKPEQDTSAIIAESRKRNKSKE